MAARGTYVRECDDREYRLTDDDVLWLARSLWGEVGPWCDAREASLVAWTMMNRFLLPAPQKNFRRWPTFTALIRGFSQPCNPDWLVEGRFCRVGGKYAQTEMCSFSRLARRLKYQTTPLTGNPRIPHNPAMYAESFARGTLLRWHDAWGEDPGPEPFVDFASTPFAKHHGTQVGDGGNYFFTKAQSKSAGLLSAFLPGAVLVVPATS